MWTQARERILNWSLAFVQQNYSDFQTEGDLGLVKDVEWQPCLHPTILSWFSDTSGNGKFFEWLPWVEFTQKIILIFRHKWILAWERMLNLQSSLCPNILSWFSDTIKHIILIFRHYQTYYPDFPTLSNILSWFSDTIKHVFGRGGWFTVYPSPNNDNLIFRHVD